jgi:mannitol-1-/sugar-/sorbitol-6-/2-deoxyglucose-6-phosphatase
VTIKAVIFDMDGILIDSEPFWREAEIMVFETISITLTHEMCIETTGLRVDEAVEYWLKQHNQTNDSAPDLAEKIVGEVIKQIKLKGTLMAGVLESLEFFQTKGAKIALASSSSYRIIAAVIDKFDLRRQFEVVYSAQEEELGKPHPGIYLTAARKLGVNAKECLAIEDSRNGVLAAKAARMKCLAIPEAPVRSDPRFSIADCVLNSLLEIDEEVWASVSN